MSRKSNREMQRRQQEAVTNEIIKRVVEVPNLSMNINPFNDHVRVEFNHSVNWLRFTPEQARQVAARILACADVVERRLTTGESKIILPT